MGVGLLPEFVGDVVGAVERGSTAELSSATQ